MSPGRDLVVHQSGGDGAARHAIKFTGRGALRHHHAASLLDGARAQGAVTAGAGEDDANGVLALVFGQGMEKIVDGQPLPMRGTGFEQVKGALHEGHVVVGGDDVGAIDRDLHAVFHLKHRTMPGSRAACRAESLGRPGMVITSPQTMTTNSAPAARRTSRTSITWPLGAPRSGGVGGEAVLRLGHADRVVAVALKLQLLNLIAHLDAGGGRCAAP
jgi:hypothetical protein